jgi:putative tryptophan/tyrosine transport system substrate-binding protein
VRRGVIQFGLASMLLSLSFAVEAQQPKKIPRIGFLTAGDAARQFTPSAAIRLALSELNYVEGQNIAMEYRYAEGKRDRYPELAGELVRLKVDIIVVTGGNVMVRATKNATKTIPIVMVGSGVNPVEAGIVESLARPGGNVTGIATLITQVSGKRLALLKKLLQNLSMSRFSTILLLRLKRSRM